MNQYHVFDARYQKGTFVKVAKCVCGYMQDVPPALLVRFLREHRSEWADYGIDAYSAASLKASPYAVPCARPGGFSGTQVILPLAHTVEHEEVDSTSFSSPSCVNVFQSSL